MTQLTARETNVATKMFIQPFKLSTRMCAVAPDPNGVQGVRDFGRN